MHRLRSLLFLLLFAFGAYASGRVTTGPIIKRVTVDRTSFDPSASDVVTLSMSFAKPGRVSILVLDRDGYRIRNLATQVSVSGAFSVGWNGRNESGDVVPNEAYSFKIVWTDGKVSETYFPANQKPAKMLALDAGYYDRRGGTLAYTLPSPCRVHLQAGTSHIDARTGKSEGPVLRTVVNRAPRSGGAIAEHWNGFDESGTVYVPDLPDFVISLAASPLSENSVITFGSRGPSFIEYAASRTGYSEIALRPGPHEHHSGLEALDDVSPELRLEVLNGRWMPDEKVWAVSDDVVRIRPVLSGAAATHFARQPATMYQFVNDHLVSESQIADRSAVVEIPLRNLSKTSNRVSLNWVSKYGNVAANTVIVKREQVTHADGRKKAAAPRANDGHGAGVAQ
jgi:hypothetical protein